jgi:Glycosyltransferase WbsX
MFMLHQPQELPEPQEFLRMWQEWARAEGLPGIFFVGTQEAGARPPHEYGFDGTIPSTVGRVFHSRLPSRLDRVAANFLSGRDTTWLMRRGFGWPTRIPYRELLRHALPRELSEFDFPSVLSNWDNTPRSGQNGLVLTGGSPELFLRHLEQAISAVEARPFERRLVFLKSWNEWAEGNFVEPDVVYGRSYLEAIGHAQRVRA